MENTEPLNDREEIVGRWALRPPQCHGTITYFVWLLKDATALWSDTYNAYEGGHLDQAIIERLFRDGDLWKDPFVSIMLRQFSVPIALSPMAHSQVLLLNGLGVFGEEDAGKLDPDKLTTPGIIVDALTLDELLDSEIKPQIDRLIADTNEGEVQTITILPPSPRIEAPSSIKVASPRIIGRWWLALLRSACPAQYGIFICESGVTTFWDTFTHALTIEASPLAWFDSFDRWQTIEELPGWSADQVCRYTRTIRLPRRLVLDILRANRKGMCTLEKEPSLACNTNLHLENIFWQEIARYLPYQPRHRSNPKEPMNLSPGPGDIIRNDPNLP